MPKSRPKVIRSTRVGHRRKHHGAGLVPGTIVVEPDAAKPSIRGIGFGPDTFEELELAVEEVEAFTKKLPVVWINVVGLGDVDVLAALGDTFGLHPLALEDVAHAHERAKVEESENYTFVVARMAHQIGLEVLVEQFSMFVGDGWVLTFQEHSGDCLDPVRERIRHGRGRVRRSESDYLAYCLLDAITDAFFPILDEFAALTERLETRIIDGEEGDLLAHLHETRRSLTPIRRAVMPLRDVVRFLEIESGMISPGTQVYLRDVADHVSVIIDEIEHLREWSASLMDVHYTVVSHKLNEVMRVLTVIATVFMPLGFVAGLYGMNFDQSSPYNMPELGWRYGYVFAWCVMLGMVGVMIMYFRRKGWF